MTSVQSQPNRYVQPFGLPPALLSIILLCLVLLGCEEEKPKTPPKPPTPRQTKPEPKKQPDAPIFEKPSDPNDPFDLTQTSVIFDIYRAESATPEKKLQKYRYYRLIDESGSPNRGRQKAYRRALKHVAKSNPKEWSAFIHAESKRLASSKAQ